MSRYLYPALLLTWLAAFAVEVSGAAHWAASLGDTLGRMEDAAFSLNLKAHAIADVVRDIRFQEEDLAFLQSMPNILPQDKGYLRTQKAIAEEVQELRHKVGSRVKSERYIVVDAKANKLYLKEGLKLLWQADCSVGRGGILKDRKTGQRWEFVTPRGEFKVLGKSENPVWRKPDWAFVESGQAIPPPDDPSRKVEGELGAYVLNLGDGYLIHGTKDESVLGHAVSHGCVRLGAQDLKKLYSSVPVGTKVFIIH